MLIQIIQHLPPTSYHGISKKVDKLGDAIMKYDLSERLVNEISRFAKKSGIRKITNLDIVRIRRRCEKSLNLHPRRIFRLLPLFFAKLCDRQRKHQAKDKNRARQKRK